MYKQFTLHLTVQCVPWSHFPGAKRLGVNVTAQLHPQPMFRISGAIISTPPRFHGVHKYTALPTSQRTQSVCILKTPSLMLFAEIIGIYCGNRMRQINTLRGQHVEFPCVTIRGDPCGYQNTYG